MHRLLPLLFLACASSTPAQYERGTYRPAPPAFSPTQDAPHTVGQPGHLHQPQEYPRSPHARVLPSSPEPGLWAGDIPQASKSTAAKPSLLGVPLPGFPVSETEEDYGLARVCTLMWDQALPGSKLVDKVNALRPEAKRCMVAWMFHTCARALEELDDVKSKDGVVLLWMRRNLSKIKQSADDFTRKACKEATLPDDQRRLLERLRATLRKSLNKPE
jgi:hypothetical protein